MQNDPRAESLRCGQTKAQADRERWKEAINGAREELELIKLCQTTPEERRKVRGTKLSLDHGHVYLKYRGDGKAHKIGSSGRTPKKRTQELKGMWTAKWYKTVIYKALELAVHKHFDYCRRKRAGEREHGQRKNAAGELFRLSPADVEDFKQTLVNLEKWVLQGEEARVELRIVSLEAAIRDSLRKEPEAPTLFD